MPWRVKAPKAEERVENHDEGLTLELERLLKPWSLARNHPKTLKPWTLKPDISNMRPCTKPCTK